MQEWRRSAVACVTVLAAVLTCRAGVAGEQATYDQRQNGDLNVQVHVQDVGIVALLDESLFSGGFGQYDYSYDYHDPEDPAQGVKPTEQEKPSTPSASDTSTEATLTSSTTVLSDSAKTTITADESASTTAALGTESNNKTTGYTESPGVKEESSEGGDKQQQSVPLIAMLLPQQGSARRRCSPGFFRDSRGRCRRQRKPGYLTLQTLPLDLPFGMQLASQTGWI